MSEDFDFSIETANRRLTQVYRTLPPDFTTMPHIEEPPFTADQIPEYPLNSPQKLKVIHVGAGASGLLFAHKATKWLQNYELICYEKNDRIGGTWYENR